MTDASPDTPAHISATAEEEAARSSTRAKVSDVHKKLVFSFIRMLNHVDTGDEEAGEAVTHILARSFDIDPAGVGGQYDSGVDLVEAFQKALTDSAMSSGSAETDEKFKSFLGILEKKGYFNDCEKGTEEYENRVVKARAKFDSRNNPFEGLTADQIKVKGNEFMQQTKYKEAITYYTKAIELEPTNSVFYSNRAAAHTFLKDYRSAIIDAEKSISLNRNYAKAYSRLGLALYYDGSYARAVDAYTKAVELDPENETFKADMKRAEEKAKATGITPHSGSAAPLGGMPGGPGGMLPGMPGMPDYSQMMGMMNNPQFMQMAQQMMANPDFSGMVSQMAQGMGQPGMGSPEEMNRFMQQMQSSGGMSGMDRSVDAEGNIQTPFGKVNHARLLALQDEEVKSNPKMRGIMEEVRRDGFGAFQKYMQDPEVMELMNKFTGMMQQEAQRNRDSGDDGGNGDNNGEGGAAAIN